jgi:hypothetical protein
MSCRHLGADCRHLGIDSQLQLEPPVGTLEPTVNYNAECGTLEPTVNYNWSRLSAPVGTLEPTVDYNWSRIGADCRQLGAGADCRRHLVHRGFSSREPLAAAPTTDGSARALFIAEQKGLLENSIAKQKGVHENSIIKQKAIHAKSPANVVLPPEKIVSRHADAHGVLVEGMLRCGAAAKSSDKLAS